MSTPPSVDLRSGAPARAEALRHLGGLLAGGGIIAFPTDTVWGIGASADHPAGPARLRAIKGRAPEHPFPLFVASANQAFGCTETPPLAAALALARAFWPGRVTLVLPLRADAPAALRELAGPDGSVGFRVPDSRALRDLTGALGAPLVNTSANRTGQPPARTAEEVVAALGSELDLVVLTDDTPGGAPSSVVRPRPDGFDLLREGAVGRDALIETLRRAGCPIQQLRGPARHG